MKAVGEEFVKGAEAEEAPFQPGDKVAYRQTGTRAGEVKTVLREDEGVWTVHYGGGDWDYADALMLEPPSGVLATATCLARAAALVDGDRRADYGHPIENHTRTAAMWSAYLGKEVTPRDVCNLMILLKVSRDAFKPKPDNLDDVCGWARNAEIVSA